LSYPSPAMKKRLPAGLRKYIRGQKARIRRDGLSQEETDKKIREFVSTFANKNKEDLTMAHHD